MAQDSGNSGDELDALEARLRTRLERVSKAASSVDTQVTNVHRTKSSSFRKLFLIPYTLAVGFTAFYAGRNWNNITDYFTRPHKQTESAAGRIPSPAGTPALSEEQKENLMPLPHHASRKEQTALPSGLESAAEADKGPQGPQIPKSGIEGYLVAQQVNINLVPNKSSSILKPLGDYREDVEIKSTGNRENIDFVRLPVFKQGSNYSLGFTFERNYDVNKYKEVLEIESWQFLDGKVQKNYQQYEIDLNNGTQFLVGVPADRVETLLGQRKGDKISINFKRYLIERSSGKVVDWYGSGFARKLGDVTEIDVKTGSLEGVVDRDVQTASASSYRKSTLFSSSPEYDLPNVGAAGLLLPFGAKGKGKGNKYNEEDLYSVWRGEKVNGISARYYNKRMELFNIIYDSLVAEAEKRKDSRQIIRLNGILDNFYKDMDVKVARKEWRNAGGLKGTGSKFKQFYMAHAIQNPNARSAMTLELDNTPASFGPRKIAESIQTNYIQGPGLLDGFGRSVYERVATWLNTARKSA